MDSLKLAHFLELRVENTIQHKQYVEKVKVYYSHGETFGNEYIQVHYSVRLNDTFRSLPEREKMQIRETFTGAAYYVYSIHTAESRFADEKFIKLLEFKNIYLSLTGYVTQQLERHLGIDASIKVKGLDDWPMLGYCEKFLDYLVKYCGQYRRHINSSYEKDVSQYEALHSLSLESKKKYRNHKHEFELTDEYVTRASTLQYHEVRRILCKYKIPVQVQGTKTIDRVYINTPAFITALKKEIRDLRAWSFSDYSKQKCLTYEVLLEEIYDKYLPDEKKKLIERIQQDFLESFPLAPNDIVQLIDGRVVIVRQVFVNEEEELKIKYCILKTNLEVSERSRVIDVGEVQFYLKSSSLRQYKKLNSVRNLSLFSKWINGKKQKLDYKGLTIDLARDIPEKV